MISPSAFRAAPATHAHRLTAPLALVLLLLAGALSGCATNPATGSSFFNLMSAEKEQKVGDEEHPKLVAQFGGEVIDARITRYIDGIGQRLARHSELPNLKYSFTLLDTDMINAFALPGGYVHITRGLLALANSEAEVAGVMAHEIGHITGRHTAQRYSQSVLAGIGVNVLSILTRSRELGQLAGTGADLYLRSYSRDHEFEADTLGVRYLKRAGYDAKAMASFLASLRAHSQLEAQIQGLAPGKIDERDLMATHPRTVERVERAVAAANGSNTVANPRVGRDAYLATIDGMVYGDSPVQGFARGRDFMHPLLRFCFRVPPGFTLANTANRVIGKGPDKSLFIFDGGKMKGRSSLTDYLVNVWGRGLRLDKREQITINGLPAATAQARANTSSGTMDLRFIAIDGGDGQVWRMMFMTPPAKTEAMSRDLREATYSFRIASAAEAATWKPWVIRLHRVVAGDTVESLAARMPFTTLKAERFRTLNGMGPGEPLRLGETVKLVVQS